MRKIHLILLIAAAITAVTSVYSLAAINQTYKIPFEWFSEFNNVYTFEKRDTARNKWLLDEPDSNNVIKVINNEQEYKDLIEIEHLPQDYAYNTDLIQYIMIYFSLGEVSSPDYSIKVTDIAQRGDVVEIIVSTNSPAVIKKNDKEKEQGNMEGYSYFPRDIIRIDKNSFPIKGKLLFVFKNQDGYVLGEQYCDIKM